MKKTFTNRILHLATIIVMMFWAVTQPADARHISVEEAMQKAQRFVQTKPKMNVKGNQNRMTAATSITLAYEAKTDNGATPCFYVFNQNPSSGWVIISADDCLPEVLGYADSGSFDISTAPDGMKWLLSSYEEQIKSRLSSADGGSLATLSETGYDSDWEPIEPMLTTMWNQETHYNKFCPTLDGEPTATGCVATALAQIMNYHKYPQQGYNSRSYYWDKGHQTLSMDFSEVTFDWDNMIDDYSDDLYLTEAQENAVATLMLAIGIAMDTDYSPTGSSAKDTYLTERMEGFFGYRGKQLSFGNDDDYHRYLSVYEELQAGHPVFLSGYKWVGLGYSGGHAFVCDGYSNDGLFHINWGWSGSCDGYFLLDALTPTDGTSYSGRLSAYTLIPAPKIDGQQFFLDKQTYEATACGTYTYSSINEYTGRFYKSGYVGDLTIPETVTYERHTYKVTGLTKDFFGCIDNNTTSFTCTLPIITELPDFAFSFCSKLTSVTLPNSITSIGSGVFSNSNSVKSLTVVGGSLVLDYVGSKAFPENGAAAGTKVKLSDKMTTVCDDAFYGSRVEVELGANIDTIGKSAFYNCQTTTELVLPEKLVYIGELAFRGCTMTSVRFNPALKFIGRAAFCSCSRLEEFVVPEGVTVELGTSAFYGCSSLKEYVIPSDVTTIYSGMFQDCSSLQKITIPDKVVSIGNNAFKNCTSLQEIVMPESLTSIGENVFDGCKSIKKIVIPDNVESIGREAFSNCSSLTELVLGAGVKTIGTYAIGTRNATSMSIYNRSSIPQKIDLVFNWSRNTGTLYVPASSVELYKNSAWASNFKEILPGHFAYRLTFKVGDEVFATYELYPGDEIPQVETPQRDGCVFSGWSEIPETMPEHNVTVTGSFTTKTYTLTYEVDGEVYKTLQVEYGTSIKAEAEPTKKGHTFSGWSEIPATMPDHDVTVTGTFTVNTYTLTYEVDGEVYKTQQVEYGTSIKAEAEPTKKGYTFSGWSEIPETMPDHDVTVKGSFAANTYTLTYEVDGEVYKTLQVEYGTSIKAEAAPTKEGYTFSGWSEIPETMPDHDVMVTGTFAVNTYTLTYMLDGEVYKTMQVEYGTSIKAEDEPTKEGYTFSGWSEIPETMPGHDVTVTGAFNANTYTLIYMIDGDIYKTLQVKYGISIKAESEPTKKGYTFSGWSEIPETMPDHDVTVTGTFAVNTYTLTYMLDGEVYKTMQVKYGTSIKAEDEPTRKGYTFSGWNGTPQTMPDHDVTVKGTFAVNTYTLTYKIDGDIYKTLQVEYGASIKAEDEPTKKGHTFSGWSGEPQTMPDHNVTVTGTFAVNTYTLTYMLDGEVYKTLQVKYGTSIKAEDEPTKEGYTFSGWSGIPQTMPDHDVTVKGSFSIIDSIRNIEGDEDDIQIYTLDGKRVKTLQKGVNIIRKSDGTTKKVIVK